MKFGHRQARKLSVTLLSGLPGAGKTTLLENVLANRAGQRVAVIVTDVSGVDIDAQLVKRGGSAVDHATERPIEMTNGCVCCTPREDLIVEVARLAREGRFDHLLIELTGISAPIQATETFTFAKDVGLGLGGIARLDTVVTVIDASMFLEECAAVGDLNDREIGFGSQQERTIIDLLVDQIEFCNVAVVNKCDLLGEKRLERVEAIIAGLNPRAQIIRAVRGQVPLCRVLDTGLFDIETTEQAAAWLAIARGEQRPETEDYGVSAFCFRARVPFHPGRLWKRMNEPWDGVSRAKGCLWLATRHDIAGEWLQAGKVTTVGAAGEWLAALKTEELAADSELFEAAAKQWKEPYGDRRQEIVFIGPGLDVERIRAELTACLLSDAEFEFGPSGWTLIDDPFPAWAPIDGSDQAGHDS